MTDTANLLPPLAESTLAGHEQAGYLAGLAGDRRARPPLRADSCARWWRGHARGAAEARKAKAAGVRP